MINQRNRRFEMIEPVEKVPVVLVEDFLDSKTVFALQNADATGFGTYYQLLVGAGSHSTVSSILVCLRIN